MKSLKEVFLVENYPGPHGESKARFEANQSRALALSKLQQASYSFNEMLEVLTKEPRLRQQAQDYLDAWEAIKKAEKKLKVEI